MTAYTKKKQTNNKAKYSKQLQSRQLNYIYRPTNHAFYKSTAVQVWGSPGEYILIKFCTATDTADVIICANFGVKIKGLEMLGLGVQILASPVETACQPYNSAALPRSL